MNLEGYISPRKARLLEELASARSRFFAAGLRFRHLIYRGRKSEIFSVSQNDGRPLIIKRLVPGEQSLENIAQLRREYEILNDLGVEGVRPVIGFIEIDGFSSLVLMDVAGITIHEFLETKPSIRQLVSIAELWARSIAEIHVRGIIQRDVNPYNALVSPDRDYIYVIDFGIAKRLSRSQTSISSDPMVVGTLPYIAPEQTGRIKLGLDERSDLYSLGASFYEMFTGFLPFPGAEALEVIHAHLAKMPMPPKERNPDLPESLSQLILRLLAKNPNDRYRSALGVALDLAEIGRRLDIDDKITLQNLEIGTRDIPLRLTTTERLYGRETELRILTEAWQRVIDGNSSFVLVQGLSGSGKTTLINGLGSQLWQGRALVGRGKYEIFGRDIPYDGIVQATRQLIANIQADDESVYQAWREKVSQALGANAGLLVDLIPELANILDINRKPETLGPQEAKARILRGFISFFSACADLGKPLIIFLDDLQWADSANLELLSIWGQESQKNTMIVGAFRQEDLETSDTLSVYLKEWQLKNVNYAEVEVAAINESAVNQWCCDVLNWQPSEAKSLASILHQRSHGNPLFVQQILQSLYRDGHLKVSIERIRWEADLAAIRLIPMSDHVITLLLNRLKSLALDAQRVIACASFVGTQFTTKILADVLKMSPQNVNDALEFCVSEELILKVEDDIPSSTSESELSRSYRFLHDRVIEAAQSLIDSGQLMRIRLDIGRVLIGSRQTCADLSVAQWPTIFQALFHCIAAQDLITDHSERERLAFLACEAGERAQAAAAWSIGSDIFHGGRKLLQTINREKVRALIRRLETGEGSCAALTGRPEVSQALFDQLLSDSKTDIEIAEVQSLRGRLYVSIEQYDKAVKTSLDALRALGEWKGSAKIHPLRGAWHVYHTQRHLAKFGRAQLMSLPAAKGQRELLIMRIIAEIAHPAMIVNPYLAILMASKQIEWVMAYGYSRDSILSFLSLVMSISGISAVLGLRFWTKRSPDLLLDIYQSLEKNTVSDRSRLEREVAYHCFASHWRADFRSSSIELGKLVPRLIEVGDNNLASAAMMLATDLGFATGQNLINIRTMLAPWLDFAGQRLEERAKTGLFKFDDLLKSLIEGNHQSMLEANKAAAGEKPALESEMVHYAGKLQRQGAVYTIFGYYDLAFRALMKALLSGLPRRQAGNYKMIFLFFYLGIANAKTYSKLSMGKKIIRLVLMRYTKYMLAIYSDMNPLLSRHKLLFIHAITMIMRKKNIAKACSMIENAIETAKKELHPLDEACMSEYLGYFLLNQGNPRLALGLLNTAKEAFERCGILLKVRDLEHVIRNLPQVLVPATNEKSSRITTTESGTIDNSSLLDVPTLTRATNALSKEIKLSDLKKTMLHLLVENAGARCAALLWRSKSQGTERSSMRIVAYRTAHGQISDEEVEPKDDLVSMRVLSFVERSKKELIISSVRNDPMWHHDTALSKRNAKSLICVPIMVAGEQAGAIYLENDLLENTFSPDRIEILSVLAGQIAISLDNAKLYDQLSQALDAERQARSEEKEAYQAYIVADAARSKLQAGIEAAEEVQKSLVKVQNLSSNYKISYLFDPAENTGGDWLTTFFDEDRSWLYLCLGDVTGHGVPAALVTAAVAGAAASTIARISKGKYDLMYILDEMCEAMNTAVIATRGISSQLMTMVVIGVDLVTGQCCYVNAGHHPVLLFGRETSVILEGGDPLGHSDAKNFGHRRLQLEPQDMLVLYSDGLVENMNTSGDRLRFGTLKRLGKQHRDPQKLIEVLRGQVAEFSRDQMLDDTACLIFQWLGNGKNLRVAS